MPPTSRPRPCSALLTDGQTRCSSRRLPNAYACAAHVDAYGESYDAYKRAADEASTLRYYAQLRRSEVCLITPDLLASRIEGLRDHLDASGRELALRHQHEHQFVGSRECLLNDIWV